MHLGMHASSRTCRVTSILSNVMLQSSTYCSGKTYVRLHSGRTPARCVPSASVGASKAVPRKSSQQGCTRRSMWDKSIPLGRILGIPVRLHVLFVALLGLQVAAGAISSWHWALYWFILLGPILLCTVLIHELGHSLAARSVGGEAHGILLWPLGGLAFIGHTAGPKADMWVAVAGPLTHIPQVVLYVLCLIPVHKANFGNSNISLLIPSPRHYLGEAVLVGALLMNIGLFAFNLLIPAYPLDGGRILVDALLACGVAPVPTAKITVAVAAPLALAIVILGGITFEIVLVLVGVWILFSTVQLFNAIRKGEVHHHPMFADVCRDHAGTGSSMDPDQENRGPNYV